MADLNVINRHLQIKRYEHQKLVALTQVQAREIRIMELEEEIARCKTDIESQLKVTRDMEAQIKQQNEELAKEELK